MNGMIALGSAYISAITITIITTFIEQNACHFLKNSVDFYHYLKVRGFVIYRGKLPI